MKVIAFVGPNATRQRIQIQMEWPATDRRIHIVSYRKDMYFLQGLRGPDFLWVDLGADAEQRCWLTSREFKEVTMAEAKAALHATDSDHKNPSPA